VTIYALCASDGKPLAYFPSMTEAVLYGLEFGPIGWKIILSR
jgi:hypothetical protein